MAGAPSTSGTTVKTCSGSRPAPIGSVYLPSAPRARPGTSEDGSGCRIHVVQPSRFLPFQSDVQPFSAAAVIVARSASSAALETTASREAGFIVYCALSGLRVGGSSVTPVRLVVSESLSLGLTP